MGGWTTRNFFHVIVKGTEEKLLPVYLHVNSIDLEDVNKLGPEFSKEIVKVIIENIETIESRARHQDDDVPTRLASTSGLIDLAFITVARRDVSNYSIIRECDFLGASCCHSATIATFEVVAWVFLVNKENPYLPLPTEEK
jgi:hypothetical protein